MEVRALLSLHDFPGDDVHFVRGSALCALEVRLGEGSAGASLAALVAEARELLATKPTSRAAEAPAAATLPAPSAALVGGCERRRSPVARIDAPRR